MACQLLLSLLRKWFSVQESALSCTLGRPIIDPIIILKMQAAATDHLASLLENADFCASTGLQKGFKHIIECSTCGSTIDNASLTLDLIYHLVIGVLKTTHNMHL